jgi:hypothetical protein
VDVVEEEMEEEMEEEEGSAWVGVCKRVRVSEREQIGGRRHCDPQVCLPRTEYKADCYVRNGKMLETSD